MPQLVNAEEQKGHLLGSSAALKPFQKPTDPSGVRLPRLVKESVEQQPSVHKRHPEGGSQLVEQLSALRLPAAAAGLLESRVAQERAQEGAPDKSREAPERAQEALLLAYQGKRTQPESCAAKVDRAQVRAAVGQTGAEAGAEAAQAGGSGVDEAAADEAAVSDEVAVTDEAAVTDVVAIADEAAASDETAAADEAAVSIEAAVSGEAAATDEAAVSGEAAATDEAAVNIEAAASTDQAVADEAATTDEAVAADEAASADEPAVDEAPKSSIDTGRRCSLRRASVQCVVSPDRARSARAKQRQRPRLKTPSTLQQTVHKCHLQKNVSLPDGLQLPFFFEPKPKFDWRGAPDNAIGR